MKRLYHPATPCNGAKDYEVNLDAVSKLKDIELVPCSEGFQLFSRTVSYWVDDIAPFKEYCGKNNISYKLYPSRSKQGANKITSWFSYSPIELELEVTRLCNQFCIHCYNNSGERVEDEFPLSEVTDLIKQFRSTGGQKLKITGGEPLMRKDLNEILEYAKCEGIRTFELTTNGTLIGEKEAMLLSSYMRSVNISLHGVGRSHDEVSMLNGSFEKALGGIRCLKEKGCNVNLYFTVMKNNMGQILNVLGLAKELNCPVRFSLLRNVGRGENLFAVTYEGVELIAKYLSELSEGKGIKLMRSELCTNDYSSANGYKFYGCNGVRSLLYVDSRGDARPCSLNQTNLGNIKELGLEGVWFSSGAFKFRENICDCDNSYDCGGKWLCGGPCKVGCT